MYHIVLIEKSEFGQNIFYNFDNIVNFKPPQLQKLLIKICNSMTNKKLKMKSYAHQAEVSCRCVSATNFLEILSQKDEA